MCFFKPVSFALALLMTAAICSCSVAPGISSDPETESQGMTALDIYGDETQPETTSETVAGVICYLTDDSFTVKTPDGAADFRFEELETEAPEYGMMLGAAVSLVYEDGALKKAVCGSVENAGRAYEILGTMTLEEKVGQLFYARFPESGAEDDIAALHLGGYILFARDFSDETPEGIADKLSSCQAASKLGMYVGVDEEGGTVVRISRYSAFRDSPFKSPRELYAEGGMELIVSDTAEKASLLTSLGINVNMAPVCDISTSPDDFMYDRSLGEDAETTSEFAVKTVETMAAGGVASVLKHFPGYGDAADTHTGIAYDSRDYSTFAESDFKPFIAGTEAGADIILVSHNIVECMDNEYPASLSEKVHRILRCEIGFYGPVMTDDLSMDAIGDYTGEADAAVMAVLAGNDLLCSTDYKTQYQAVLNAAKEGVISEGTLDRAVMRILVNKLKLGIIF